MKLSKIYSNKEDIFPLIRFKDGFNVIFARVKEPKLKEQDSHNLGKSFLIKVIDFALLADIDKGHAFKKNEDLFEDFTFFIELKTDDDKYVVVKRPVSGRANICINVADDSRENLASLQEEAWTYRKLSLTAARKELDKLLRLDAIKPFTFRKGLGYFLRSQNDYADVFRISKFIKGADVYWKPFVALILGFDSKLVEEKYGLDADSNKLQEKLDSVEDEAGSKSDEYDAVKGLLEIKESAVNKIRRELDSFSFQEIESQINERLVSEIETKISAANKRRYAIDYELQETDKALNSGLEFDIEKIAALFSEIEIVLPTALVRGYQDVVDFNRRMSSGRTARLQQIKQALSQEREALQEEITRLDAERQQATAILNEQKTLEKYRQIQRQFSRQEAEVIELQHRLAQLDRAAIIQKDMAAHKQKINTAIQGIKEDVRKENGIYTVIRTTFSECVEKVLSVPALMSVAVNSHGNLEFNATTLDRESEGRETSEGTGNSYRKILCASFDLSVLRAYSDRRFYHFVYHDGIFEGLDNRKKVSLLELSRSFCKEHKIQYILTVIDSDLPRDERDQKLLFTSDEVIRELHDQGKEGRLFRMQAF